MESIALLDFLQQMFASPMLLVSTLLTLGVILVNGWTDAPNAIATCVSTRAIGVRAAIVMAAIFNFLGVLVMTFLTPAVADTVGKMVDFGDDPRLSLIGLCAAMTAIVVWATAAWYFGIPTSESHALIAGLSGAAIAVSGGISGIDGGQWLKVLYGIVLSTILGFGLGFGSAKLTVLLARNSNRLKSERFFSKAQIAGGAAMAFMHGAQDGQKFMAVFLLGAALSQGQTDASVFQIPIWLMVICSLVMALGTSIGGYRIIKSVGMDMVKMKPYQGFAADLSATICLILSSVGGLPVSTTHTKTTSIMGVGAAKRVKSVNWGVVKEMVLTWVITFPGCGLLGFGMAHLFMWIFI